MSSCPQSSYLLKSPVTTHYFTGTPAGRQGSVLSPLVGTSQILSWPQSQPCPGAMEHLPMGQEQQFKRFGGLLRASIQDTLGILGSFNLFHLPFLQRQEGRMRHQAGTPACCEAWRDQSFCTEIQNDPDEPRSEMSRYKTSSTGLLGTTRREKSDTRV